MPCMINIHKRKKGTQTVPFTIYECYTIPPRYAHTLIAGASGSGKSVYLNGLLTTILATQAARLILADLKKVELYSYKRCTSTLAYADTLESAIKALQYALDLCEHRYTRMQKQRVKSSLDVPVYVIIDELADLITLDKKHVIPLLQRIGQIGRAANVHLIVCTQCPLSSIIPTAIKVNFDCVVGLRVRSKQDSRNVCGMVGLETLPRYGQCVIFEPATWTKFTVPMLDDRTIDTITRLK
jgi:S-DNA-T family DNA segregation ATPase FtsK/SpoIIIE